MPLPLDFVRGLRADATPAERALWRSLSDVRPRFTRQYRIGPYVADFACRRAKVVVELDGSQHAESRSDATRDKDLAADGWIVMRFWNNEALTNAEGVVTAIFASAKDRLPPSECFVFVDARPSRSRKKEEEPPPAPPRSRGGE